MSTVSTRQFSFSRSSSTFVAEVSDLGSNPFIRVWPDAADEGVELVSHVTGLSVKFAVDRYEYTNDADRELVAWHLTPTRESINEMRQHGKSISNVKMVIFND